ncbi:MAG: 2,3-bisphosphoglycerate-independent phosphoglycerate mutase [Clostridia bacterium]|nr:2,3-bisphosphoglycerate-independent phosphoglycerate mutase [Clostridia bacterium]
MKYILVIGDGMADEPIAALQNKTPLESLSLPHFDRVSHVLGKAQTVPAGVAPGSDTAILNIFGYDPRTYYTGRSSLEAAGMGVFLNPGEVSLRVNLCAVEEGVILSHNGGNIEGEEAVTLMETLVGDPRFAEKAEKLQLRIHITPTFRHIGVFRCEDAQAAFTLTPPHDVLGDPIEKHLPQGTLSKELTELMLISFEVLDSHPINQTRRSEGKLPANMIWPWAEARAAQLPSFKEKYGKSGAVISAVPLLHGIAGLAGLDVRMVEGANGDLDTNYEGKVAAAVEQLQNHDFVCVHVEAPDEMSHAGSMEKKLKAIEYLNERVVGPLLEGVKADFRLLLLSDHPTLLATRTHDGNAVPFGIYDSRESEKAVKFCEKTCDAGIFVDNGDKLMPLLFEQEEN